MSMTVPVVPSLPAGYVVQLADLQALANAASFLLSKPITRILDETGGVSIGTSPTTVTFTNAILDTDGMWNASNPDRLTVQTPGWYKLRYAVNCGTAGNAYVSWVTVTTGGNNPAGSGVVLGPYWAGYSDTAAAGLAGHPGSSGVWPTYLYAGDYMQVKVQANTTGASTGTGVPGTATLGGSFFSLEYVSTT